MARSSRRLNVEVDGSSNLRRLGLLLLKITPLLLAIVLLLGAFYHSRKRLYFENPYFLLKHIDVIESENYSRMRVQTMLSEMGIETGRHTLPNLPLHAIRQRFMLEPMLAEVEVRRIFPDRLQIRLSERRPVAILHFPSHSILPPMCLDRHGYVLPGGIRAGNRQLPVINHIPQAQNLKIGERTDNPSLLAVLHLLNQLAIRPEGNNYDVFLIQINHAENQLNLRLNRKSVFKQSALVILSMDQIIPGLERLKQIVRLRQQSGQSISFIDVSYEKNIPVRP